MNDLLLYDTFLTSYKEKKKMDWTNIMERRGKFIPSFVVILA